MTIDRFRRILLVSVALYFIGSAVVAQAQDAELPFTPTLTAGGTNLVNDDVFANADGSYTLLGHQQGGNSGGLVWDLSWNLTLNQDPSIGGSLTLRNLTTTTRNFNLQFSLPILPAFSSSVFGGSLDARITDTNNDGTARMAPLAVSPSIYRGMIDSTTVLSLFAADLQCFGAGCSGGGIESAGLPGLTLQGPGASNSITTWLNFSLTAGDSVTFLTNFVVEPPAPVPLPAALPMLLAGLGGFFSLRRRRAA